MPRGHSFNIIGLSFGFACAIILSSWVLHETSYDRYVPDGDMIYRVTLEGYLNGEFINSTQSLAGIGPEAKNVFPEVVQYTRLSNNYKDCVFKLEGQDSFRESGYAADSTFFSVFPYQAVYGELAGSLLQKDQIVLDRYLSEKCFGK